MTSLLHTSYAERAAKHKHPVAKRLLQIAADKETNLVVSADLTTSDELIKCADILGPHIAVFKTHIDIVSDLTPNTLSTLATLAAKHNFLIFEDRKLMDIGSTVQKQYHNGALQISSFAHIVNLSILPGDGVVQALAQVLQDPEFPYRGERGLLLLAEMTSKGSFATGAYTARCVDLAREYTESVLGFVATRSLAGVGGVSEKLEDEDFITFTTGVNVSAKGDALGQQYQSPSSAMEGGADFIIAGRGIYKSDDMVAAAELYKRQGWEAYEKRIGGCEVKSFT